MSGLRRRLARSLGGEADGAEAVQQRLAELDARSQSELARQEALLRELAADLTERVAALERRIGALEAREP